MGLVRFLLATVVVLFHTTRLNWVPGRMAVDGFFVLSGFVITRTLVKNYLGDDGSIRRFYLNRILRLVPPYLAVLFASGGLVVLARYVAEVPLHSFHPFFYTAFDHDAATKVASSFSLRDLRPSFDLLHGGVPSMTFQPVLIPQAWSLGIEFVFYLVAPILAVIALGRHRGALVGLGLLTIVPWVLAAGSGTSAVDAYFYRNVVTSFPLFAIGAIAATLRQRVLLPSSVGLAVAFGYVVALIVQSRFGPAFNTLPSRSLFVMWQVVTAAAMLVVVLARPWRGRIGYVDRRLGDLSYGVYIVHGVPMLFLPLLSLALTPRTWSTSTRLQVLTGHPYSARYGAVIVVATVGLAWLLWRFVESPLATVRTRVRRTGPIDPDLPGAVFEGAEVAAQESAETVHRRWVSGLWLAPRGRRRGTSG